MNNISSPTFLPGDKVYYTGEKYRERLNGKPGWIHWYSHNEEEVYTVEFPDTRNPKDPEDTDDYIMSVKVLTTRKPHVAEKDNKDKKQEGPEIQPRRRPRKPEEE